MNYTVFFSWQSDLGAQQTNHIRGGLNEARKKIPQKHTLGDTSIKIDEATRDMSGSPDIASSIQTKIKNSDIFVADVTLIDANTQATDRRSPNPNVMFELGFAVSELGWERIVMLFNSDLPMTPDDLPFDIRQHRATAFTSSKKDLADSLVRAVGLIIIKSPPRPRDALTSPLEEARHQRDTKALRAALCCIDTSEFDLMVDCAPQVIKDTAFHHFHSLDQVVSASSFLLYDNDAATLLTDLRNHWEGLLSYGVHYSPLPSGDYQFQHGIGSPRNGSVESDYDALTEHCHRLPDILGRLLRHVHDRYVDLDIQSLSMIARQTRIAFQTEDAAWTSANVDTPTTETRTEQ